jgi:hypothetical protein
MYWLPFVIVMVELWLVIGPTSFAMYYFTKWLLARLSGGRVDTQIQTKK